MKKPLAIVAGAALVLALAGCGKTAESCDTGKRASSSVSGFVPVRPPVIPPRVYVPPVRPVAPAPRPAPAVPARPAAPSVQSPVHPYPMPFFVPFFGGSDRCAR